MAKKIYDNVEAYVKANGYKMKDLTPEELEAATGEMEALNAGLDILDGVFSRPLKKDLKRMFPDIEL